MLAVDERLRLDGHTVAGGVCRRDPGQQPLTLTSRGSAFCWAVTVLGDKERR